jgi:hypothetical protein
VYGKISNKRKKEGVFVRNNQSLTPIFICTSINWVVAYFLILPLIPELYFKNLIDSLTLGFFVGLGVYMGEVIGKSRDK